MEWDETSFRARIRARARELGYSSLGALLERAGVGEDYLRRRPGKQGRGILNIASIARVCQWTLAEALGCHAQTPDAEADRRRLRIALEAADRTIGQNMQGAARMDALAQLQHHAYVLLSEWERDAGPLPDERLLSMIAAVLAREFSLKK